MPRAAGQQARRRRADGRPPRRSSPASGRRPARSPAAARPADGRSRRRRPRSPGRGRKSGRAARARCTNSVVASSTGSGGTGHTCSPATPSASRLVASTTTPGQSRRSAGRPAGRLVEHVLAVVQHEQQRAGPAGTRSASARSSGRAVAARRSAAATAWPTGPPSASGASSHSHTPSGNRARSRPATSSASRDLPTPPTPVSVTSGAPRSAAAHPATSGRPGPTKLVAAPRQVVAGRGAAAVSAGRAPAADGARRVGSDGSTPSSSTSRGAAPGTRPARRPGGRSGTARASAGRQGAPARGTGATSASSSVTTSPVAAELQQGLGALLHGGQPQVRRAGRSRPAASSSAARTRRARRPRHSASAVSSSSTRLLVVPGRACARGPRRRAARTPRRPARRRPPRAGSRVRGTAAALRRRRRQHRPQPRNIGPQRAERVARRIVAPHGGHQPVGRDHRVPAAAAARRAAHAASGRRRRPAPRRR